ncbi:MAG: immunoglobulin domain-containing protein [Planctomycetota bacterium]|nr:MAG: immunoglobulin domain-containing protein [Planctomycetota bacterium]
MNRRVIFLIAALIVVGTWCPQVFAQPGYWVGIDLGNTNVSTGITHVQPADGTTTPATIGGLNCRKNLDPATDNYMYFAVDNNYAFQGDSPNLYITIHYYDSGTGRLRLQYDAASGSYINGSEVDLTNSNKWREWSFHVTDAYFGDRQANGADFRIHNVFGGTNFYFDQVYVRRFCEGQSDCVRLVPSTWYHDPNQQGLHHGEQARDMFENPGQWPQARAETDIFGIASMDIAYGGWTDQEIQTWMGMIQEWDLLFSMEDGAIPGWTCDSQVAFNNTSNNLIGRIFNNGGRVDIITNDHSLSKAIQYHCWGTTLQSNYANALAEVVEWYSLVRTNYPDMQIFEWSPYPHLSISTIQSWIRDVNDGCGAIGIRGMDAFLLDVDWRRFPGDGNWSQVKSLENYCRTRGVPFSLAYWCAPHTRSLNDADWYNDVMRQGNDYRNVGGQPDVYDHVSWETIPTAVPETQAYTQTYTLVDFVAQFVPSHVVDLYDAEFVGSTIPDSMVTNEQRVVAVTMRNSGALTWTRDEDYKLGAVGNNDPFASTRHLLPQGMSVKPGEQYTYTFQMTAPATAGTYLTDWQMLRELVRWFGDIHGKNVIVQAPTINPPTITQHPQSQLVPRGSTAQFSVSAAGQGTLGYQWYKDGEFVSDGGNISGATMDTLEISDCQESEEGEYHCVVSNAGGSTASNAATLSLPAPGDFDIDGDVDQEDFGHLQLCMSGIGIPQTDPDCQDADFDDDTDVDQGDFNIFENCMSGSNRPPLCL